MLTEEPLSECAHVERFVGEMGLGTPGRYPQTTDDHNVDLQVADI